LSLAKSEQAKAEAQKEVSAKKETEVSMLKEQLAGLQEKTRQIDAYRDQFASLQKQSEDAARRMQSLMDENRRLKLLADEKSSNVSALESRIEKLTKDAHVSGKDSMKEQQELARLQAALDAARTEQKAAEKMKSVVSGRELEIVQLKEQLADLQKQAHQLEEYRKQVLALQKESAEKSRLLDEKDGAVRSRKPVMVPSF
jgi:myosin heavy subunit